MKTQQEPTGDTDFEARNTEERNIAGSLFDPAPLVPFRLHRHMQNLGGNEKPISENMQIFIEKHDRQVGRV